MPEPFAIASAASTIVVNGIKLCLSVYGTIDGMKQAPKHLQAVSYDLKDFYSILGTIQYYLDDKELTHGLLHTQSCENLQSILANSVSVLQDFENIVSGYIKAGQELSVTKWQKVAWTWKLADVENLRKHLSDHKASLSIAIGMANLINNDIAQQTSASQWADAKAQIALLVTKLSRLDESMHDANVVMENQRATIRAFANDAESILTLSLAGPTHTPSVQVSTFRLASTRSASFVTAWSSPVPAPGEGREATPNHAVYPRQLMIRGIGKGTAVVRISEVFDEVEVQFRYGHQLMVAVEQKLHVPTIFFWLTYAGKRIEETTDVSFVPDNATVFAHYRAVGARATIVVKTLTGREEAFHMREGSTVADLEEQVAERFGVPVAQQRLIANGKRLGDDEHSSNCLLEAQGIWSTSSQPGCVHLVIRLARSNRLDRLEEERSSDEQISDDEQSSDDSQVASEFSAQLALASKLARKRDRQAALELPLWSRFGRRVLIPTWRRPSRWSI